MITLRDVHKRFGEKQVLNGVSTEVPKGQSLVVIGGSGTGKSVLLKCILGLEEPDSGSITVGGIELAHRSRKPLFSHFGMLFQGGALFDSLPIWQNVAFRLLRGPHKLARADAYDVAITKLKRVGLDESVANLHPAELSGGMQKRASLARAIATDPDIIFFDEPTTGLDPIMAGVINDLIREIVSEMGATTITITHDMTSVHAIADRVAMLHRGKIRWQGPVNELATCNDPYIEQFVSGAAEGPIAALR